MGAVRWRGSYVRGNKKGVEVDGSTHPQITGPLSLTTACKRRGAAEATQERRLLPAPEAQRSAKDDEEEMCILLGIA